MTTLPNPRNRSHLVRNPCERRAKSVRWVAAPVIALAVIVGCVSQSKVPTETVFNEPVEVKLPTTQIDEAIQATEIAEAKSNDAVEAVEAINAQNIEQTKPEANRLSKETRDAIRSIYTPLNSAKSINEVAADRIIEATNQTNDARDRLRASEQARATERKEAQKKIDAANKRAERSEAWLPRVVSGLSILVGVGLIGVGVYSFLAVKTKLNGTALILTGAAMLGVGSALWWFGWIIGLIGLVALSIWTGFLIYLQIARQRNQTLQVATGMEALKAAGEIEMSSAVVNTLNATQTDRATKALVNVVTDRVKKSKASK